MNPTKIIACFLTLALVVGGLFPTSSAQTQPEPDDPMFELVTGTTGEGNHSEETKDWQKGDYVGFRLSKEAWFYIIYGTEENPNHITLASLQLRYLGGATIQDKNGNEIIDQIGIPVVTIYAQTLFALFEFQDEGYEEKNMFGEKTGNITGAHNNLWDFKRTTTDIDEWDNTFVYTEPVVKAAVLNTSWERSEILTSKVNGTDHFDFSLTSEQLEYGDEDGKVWDQEYENDETNETQVAKVEFTFHIDISMEDITIKGIPWYDVQVDGRTDDIEVISSTKADSRDFTGKKVGAEYKFDHYIEGWDYKDLDKDTKLMLETASMFGTFVPDIVNTWFDKQFVEEIDDALGFAEYEYENAGAVVDAVIGENSTAPDRAHLVQKESISFKDNWRQLGEQTWISDVEVDDETLGTYFQIHAGQDKSGRGDNDDGHFKALVIVGGYIYPAGNVIFHDPGFNAVAIILDINSQINIFAQGAIGLQFLMGLVAASVAGVIGLNRRRKS